MANQITTFVRMYQDGECVKTIRGDTGSNLIKEFFNNQNPSGVIRRDYPRISFIYDRHGGIKAQQTQIMFPKTANPDLVHYKLHIPNITTADVAINRVHYYNGSIYLVEVEQRHNTYKIKNIYIAEYISGKLYSLCHTKPMKPAWFHSKLGFIDMKQSNEDSIYSCTVYTTNQSTLVDLKVVRYQVIEKEKK